MDKILVIGSLNMDFVINIDAMPKAGQTILGNSVQLIPGGKGANQAYAAGKLSSKVSMIGAVGEDDNGAILIKNLKSAGVDTIGISKIKDKTTGAAFITVNKDGENSIIVIPGANMEVTPQLIDQNVDLIDQCDIVLMQFEIPIKTVEYAAKLTKRKNKIVILDPAPAPEALPSDLLKYIDILKPNETELQILSGVDSIDFNNTRAIADASKLLLNRGAKTVIVTLGSRGSLIVSEDSTIHSPSINSGKVLDTTAAGDCFTAAFAAALVKGFSYEEAARFANTAASIAVTRKGAQTSMPDFKEVSDRLRKEV